MKQERRLRGWISKGKRRRRKDGRRMLSREKRSIKKNLRGRIG